MSEQNKIINAEPTKDFFINMLVKDIELPRAILDLVDNCVDGALRIRPNRKFDGLFVKVEVSPEKFRIKDNCGGLDAATARDYAFRFGRPENGPEVPHSVGQFGVGMKRAIFKLGSKFRIESTWKTSHFVVDEDINEWKGKEKWEFEFKEVQEKVSQPDDKRGTEIVVTALHENVRNEFGLENSLNRVRSDMAQAHQKAMVDGLTVTFNAVPLELSPILLLSSDELKAAYADQAYANRAVKVKVYAGISEPKPGAAGWYIYCNGRMILGADQTITTGWGEGGEKTIPKYHNQFDRFRGLVFFDSDEAGLLPWNTTKTGVDRDSEIFKAVRLTMVTLMRQVIDFLNRLDQEKSAPVSAKPLKKMIEGAILNPVDKVKHAASFEWPRHELKVKEPDTTVIKYSRPQQQVEHAKKKLKVTSAREVGERTFDYYYERECE